MPMDDLSFAAMWEEDYPRVTDWLKRARSRTSFAQAFYPKSRLSEFLTIAPLRRLERVAATGD